MTKRNTIHFLNDKLHKLHAIIKDGSAMAIGKLHEAKLSAI